MSLIDRHSTVNAFAQPPAQTRSRNDVVWDRPAVLLVGGLIAMSIHTIQISIAQLAHIWAIVAIGMMVLHRSFRINYTELFGLLLFLYVAATLTFFQDYPRVKEVQQFIKFAFFYPAFYFLGKWLGWHFRSRPLPVGYIFMCLFLLFQFLLQALNVPLLYQPLDFGGGSLHGSFRERNWLAVYFLLVSYILYLKDESRWKSVWFLGLNAAVLVLSQSKTTFVACGIIFLIRSKLPLALRLIPIIAGAFVYMTVLSDEFTADKIAVKLEEERGLALTASMQLIAENPLGYGFGFVEAYFGNSWQEIRGLGAGVNSVFSSPVDLWLIGGFAGLVFWAIFFLGIGNGAFVALVPIAALTLLNPLHQSELVYFYVGFIVSLAKWQNLVARNRLRSRPRG